MIERSWTETMAYVRFSGLIVTLFALALLLAPTISAKGGDVRVRGTCTKASSSKLKLSLEDGRIETEFEVDQNRNGIRWSVVLRRVVAGGSQVLVRATRVTRAPSGSFEFRRVVSDRAGKDTLKATATSPSGEVCRATASI
jgi:hypothetical protein